jgi:hypothetical protein
MPSRPDIGARVDFSKKEIFKFEKDIKLFVAEFGEKALGSKLRSAVNRYPLREAKAILAQEAQTGSGSLEDRGLLVTKEKGGDSSASLLMGGGRAKKNIHGFIAHWVELGTSGIVRDGGERYKSGTRYRSPTKGIHFLERSAENTKEQMFASVQKSFDKAFRKLGR